VLTTLGLSTAVVVVAIASRWPLSRSTPVDAHAAQAPTVALLTALVGVGSVMVGALLAVAWSGRRRKDDPPEPEPPPREIAWWWKLLALLLPLALGAAVIVAAVTGARRTQPATPVGGLGLGIGSGLASTAASRNGAGGGFVLPSWLPWTLLAIVLAGLVVVGIFVLVRWRSRLGAEASDQTAASAAIEAAIGALDSDADPRRAVIAAYGAMQRTLGEHGVTRLPAEAPREYLARVLRASRATERDVRTLTDLFEEARYSSHPIPERVRKAALSALGSLQVRLRAEAAK